jgi:hypothetical protein
MYPKSEYFFLSIVHNRPKPVQRVKTLKLYRSSTNQNILSKF